MPKGAVATMERQGIKRIDTTLGELIAAASEVAFEYSNNDEEASHPIELAEEFDIQVIRNHYLH
jgi:hypothetical protein